MASVVDAVAEVGLIAEFAVYNDDASTNALAAHRFDGALVWVDPVTGSDDRTKLDALLRDVASEGVWVSAHPDTILKMGTKEVLFHTRELGWGSEIYLYRTVEDFAEHFGDVSPPAGHGS